MLYDRHGKILFCNPAAEKILGLARGAALGRTPLDSRWQIVREDGTPFPGEQHPALVTLREGIPQQNVIMGIAHSERETTWISVNSAPIFLEDVPGLHSVVVTFADISDIVWLEEQITIHLANINDSQVELEIKAKELVDANAQLSQANDRLEALATTDGLTGLKNHRAFQERLAEEFKRSARYGSPLSLILLDVDKFKLYNDTYGHPAGDRALQMVAQALQQSARETDFVARYGGEEFVILLPDSDRSGAMTVAERFRVAISVQPWVQGMLTASLGVTSMQPKTISPQQLIDEADKALYASKAAGRNRSLHYMHLNAEITF